MTTGSGSKPARMSAQAWTAWRQWAAPLLVALYGGLICFGSGTLTLDRIIGDRVLWALLLMSLLLPAAYFMAPNRLRNRSRWLVLAEVFFCRAAPMLLIGRWVSAGSGAPAWEIVLFVGSTTGWFVCRGLRRWLAHQTDDFRPDGPADFSQSGRSTRPDGQQFVIAALLPAERVCLGIFLMLLLPCSAVAATITLLYAALKATQWLREKRLVDVADSPRFSWPWRVSQEQLVTILMLGLTLQLALSYPWVWMLFAAHTIVAIWDAGRGWASADKTATADFQVVLAATDWTVNGVNVFSANLARGLIAAGIPAQVLLTEHDTELVTRHEVTMPRPADVPFVSLPLGRKDGWGTHWGAMLRWLEESAPCVYIPNSDWRHSAVCPMLSDDVLVVGVIHSDDPLHYDHVRRLGAQWNVIVAVSKAVAQRTAELCPEIADRIVTIPIGVNVPKVRPVRAGAGEVLRLIYHGVLKQHQKRVLDLPKIVQCALDLGVPVELSIAGAGPDEDALRAACSALVERGAIRFLGVASPEHTATLLERHDVYLLASEFEGMPNALLEAMGRGCVPVVSRMTSGIPELIREGDNGFMAPVGDAAAFAARLQTLWKDPLVRERMSANAFNTVRNGGFRVEDMVAAYRRAFADAWSKVRTGAFRRPRGPLNPPPAMLAGINLFPVALPQVELDVGAFPSLADAEDYHLQVAHTAKGCNRVGRPGQEQTAALVSGAVLENLTVFVAAPAWTCNGVNLWSEDLVRGLRKAGLDARILLTEESTELVRIDAPRLARANDIPFQDLELGGPDNWGARWGAMIRTLESAGPCIYIPTYDWRHSCIVPALSDRVKVVGTVHEADPMYTDHAARLSHAWDAAVAISYPIARHIRQQVPGIASRLAVIQHGLDIPADFAVRPPTVGAGLSILILGSGMSSFETNALSQWTAAIARCLPAARTLVFDPPHACIGDLRAQGSRVFVNANRQQWMELCRSSDIVIAGHWNFDVHRSWFEAMGNGCVPLWLGDPVAKEMQIEDGVSGWIVADDNLDRAIAEIQNLLADPVRHEQVAARAHGVARHASVCSDQMIDQYLALFKRLTIDSKLRWHRRIAAIQPPTTEIGNSIFPPELLEDTAFGRFPSADDARRFVEEAGTWHHLA